MALYKIKFVCFLLLLNFPVLLNAQVYPDSALHNQLKNGIDLIIDQKYEKAEKIFNNLKVDYKNLPFGDIYLAAVSIAKSYDYEIPFDDQYINSHLKNARVITDKLLETEPDIKWHIYFYGLCEGYSAYYEALNNNWLSAISTGYNSVSAFENLLEIDSSFYEALIALGSYKYWSSRKTEALNWLPFFNDERELGIRYLQTAVRYSGYNSHLAVHSLIWIFIDQGKFTEAISVAETALKRYPDSRIFKWGLARANENTNPERSIQLYEEILNSYPQTLTSNKINIVTLNHIIAQLYFRNGSKAKALALCNDILSTNDLNEYEKEKLEERFERVKELKKQINGQ